MVVKADRNLRSAVIIAALGYFVDVYDILLFGVVKTESLNELGFPKDQLALGIILTNYQVIGLVFGGIVWGILGDKRGRLYVLLGSILLYSLANIANAFITSLEGYKLCRLIAGFGLAGELGAGICLVMELSNRKTNRGPQIITAFGLLGAVVAGILGQLLWWRVAYFLGGIMGLSLLTLRFKIKESFLFLKQLKGADKGNFFMLFTNIKRIKKYIIAILIGIPTYFGAALLIQSSEELGRLEGLKGITSGTATITYYLALVGSDYIFTRYSNTIRSRKKVFIGLHIGSLFALFYFILGPSSNNFLFYMKYFIFGITIGYWGLVLVNASEQFGTNIRNLACTTVPNFIRGSFYFIGLSFTALKTTYNLSNSLLIIGVCLILIALLASLSMKDSFHKSLDVQEI